MFSVITKVDMPGCKPAAHPLFTVASHGAFGTAMPVVVTSRVRRQTIYLAFAMLNSLLGLLATSAAWRGLLKLFGVAPPSCVSRLEGRHEGESNHRSRNRGKLSSLPKT